MATALLAFAHAVEVEGESSENENIKQYSIHNKGATTDRTPREKRALHLKQYLGI